MNKVRDDLRTLNTWVDTQYPTLPRIVSYLREMTNAPSKLKGVLDGVIQQFSIMLSDPQHFPSFVEIIATLSTWPMRLGFAKIWGDFVERAYRLSEAGIGPEFIHQLALLQSKIAFDRGNLEEANAYAQKAIDFNISRGTPRQIVAAISHASTVLIYQGKLNAAFELISDSKWAQLKGSDSSTSIHFAVAQLVVFRRLGMADSIRKLIANMLPETLEIADERSRAVWFHNVGLVEEVNGNYEAAIAAYNESRSILAQLSDVSEIGLITEIARVSMYGGNLNTAYQYYMVARQQADQILDYIRGMKIRADLALLYLAQGTLHLAFTENEIALQRAHNLNIVPEINRLTGNLGIIHFHLGRLPEARDLLEEDRQSTKHRTQALAHNNAYLSRVYRRLGNNALALQLAQNSFEIATMNGYDHLQVISYRALAECTEAVSDATEYLRTALALARKKHFRYDEAACLLSLSSLSTKRYEKPKLWKSGAKLLEEVGASAWLNGLRDADNLFLPFLS